MPRPQKCRRICFTPQYDSFYPENSQTDDTITLTLDEFCYTLPRCLGVFGTFTH